MATTAKKLQKPSIIGFTGASLFIAHPDISSNPLTYTRAAIAAGATSLTVADNNKFIDDDWFILGEIGDSKTEECDINGAVTRGTALTITNTNKFSHDIDTPMTKIYERQIKVYGTNTAGVAGTQVGSTTNIAWDKESTEFLIPAGSTSYTYYYVTFYDAVTESTKSDEVTYSSGLASNSIQYQVNSALLMTDETLNENGKINRSFLLEQCNKWQDTVAQYVVSEPNGTLTVKDWPFELIDDTTSLTTSENNEQYALSSLTYEMKYPNSNQGIKGIRIGSSKNLDYIDPSEMDDLYEGVARTTLSVQATAGQTSITLTDSYEFPESGSVKIGSDTITYTTNTESTGVLSGIPASGDGSITTTHAVGAPVWEGVTPGLSTEYTIFNGNIKFDAPISSDYAGQKIKIKYLKKLTRFTDLSDTTEIPFYNTLETFLRGRIEIAKGNREEGNQVISEFNDQLKQNAEAQSVVLMDSYSYYSVSNKDNGYA